MSLPPRTEGGKPFWRVFVWTSDLGETVEVKTVNGEYYRGLGHAVEELAQEINRRNLKGRFDPLPDYDRFERSP